MVWISYRRHYADRERLDWPSRMKWLNKMVSRCNLAGTHWLPSPTHRPCSLHERNCSGNPHTLLMQVPTYVYTKEKICTCTCVSTVIRKSIRNKQFTILPTLIITDSKGGCMQVPLLTYLQLEDGWEQMLYAYAQYLIFLCTLVPFSPPTIIVLE